MSDLRMRLLAAVAGKEDRPQKAESKCDGVTSLTPFVNAGVTPPPSVTPQFPNTIRAVTPSHSDLDNKPYGKVVTALSECCPDLVEEQRWRNAVIDATVFLRQWRYQAAALGWAPRDLFGLADVPDKPGQNYQRLSRYDQMGLVWVLQGRRVVALTKDTAVIQTTNGSVSYYRLLRSAGGGQR